MSDMTGHNRVGVTREVFAAHVAKISAAESEVKLAREKLKKLRKGARADGIILGVLDRTRQLVELTREDQETEMIHTQSYLRWLRSPIGTQFEFSLGDESPEEESDEQVTERVVGEAKDAGYRAGLEGKLWEDENPHEANSPAGQAWTEGYREGQDERLAALKEKAAPVT